MKMTVGRKGAVSLGLIAMVFAALVLLVSQAKGPFAVLPYGYCYVPGQSSVVRTDPVKVTQSSGSGHLCLVSNYWDGSGKLNYNTQCKSLGSVTSGQVIQSADFGWVVPSSAQEQIIGIAVFVSTDNRQDSPTANDIWAGRISEIDEVDLYVKSSCPAGSNQTSGERNVNYFTGCDNGNPSQGKLIMCTRERYDASGSQCVSSTFVSCETGSKCVSSPDGRTGICLKETEKKDSREECLAQGGKWIDPGLLGQIGTGLFGGVVEAPHCELGINRIFGDFGRFFGGFGGQIIIILLIVAFIVAAGKGLI